MALAHESNFSHSPGESPIRDFFSGLKMPSVISEMKNIPLNISQGVRGFFSLDGPSLFPTVDKKIHQFDNQDLASASLVSGRYEEGSPMYDVLLRVVENRSDLISFLSKDIVNYSADLRTVPVTYWILIATKAMATGAMATFFMNNDSGRLILEHLATEPNGLSQLVQALKSLGLYKGLIIQRIQELQTT